MRGIKRFNEISKIVIKYGLGEFIEYTKIRKKNTIDETTIAFRFRRMLEELGPTFVKFGQLLSTQEGVLPQSFINELKNLQDNVEPFDFKDVKRIIKDSLHKDINEIFSEFEEVPEASASLGQVHKAKLKNSAYVAVKVQRPNIRETINSDMFLLKKLGMVIRKKVSEYFNFDIMPLIDEFDKTIKRELDYEIEAHFIEVFKKNLSVFENVHVPEVYWEFTSGKIITMEYVFGYKATNKQSIIDAGFDLNSLAEEGAKVFWYQIFDVGLFHADPHPGNIIIMKDGRICYIDYGMVGKINDDDKLNLIEMISGFIEKDADRILYSIDNFATAKGSVNKLNLKNDIDELIELYHSLPLKRMSMSKILRDVFAVLRKHGIIIKRSSSRLLRAIIIADGVGRDFYPDFNFVDVAKPYFKRFAKKFYSPLNVLKLLAEPNPNYLFAIKKLPIVSKRLLDSLEDGSIKIHADLTNFDKMISTFRYVARQIGISLVLSSIIIGESLLLMHNVGPKLHSIPISLLISIVVILLLIFGIVDSERKL